MADATVIQGRHPKRGACLLLSLQLSLQYTRIAANDLSVPFLATILILFGVGYTIDYNSE